MAFSYCTPPRLLRHLDYSKTYKRWMEATVLGHLPHGNYELDIQPCAQKDSVRRRPGNTSSPGAITDVNGLVPALTNGTPNSESANSNTCYGNVSNSSQCDAAQLKANELALQVGAGLFAGNNNVTNCSSSNTPHSVNTNNNPTDKVNVNSEQIDEFHYKRGMLVEYWSSSLQKWILTEVKEYDSATKTYHLDCKFNVPRDRIRPHDSADRIVGGALNTENNMTHPVLNRLGDEALPASRPIVGSPSSNKQSPKVDSNVTEPKV